MSGADESQEGAKFGKLNFLYISHLHLGTYISFKNVKVRSDDLWFGFSSIF